MKTDSVNIRNTRDFARLINKDVYRYIASNSSLTQAQVEECFRVYRGLIEQMSTSQYIDEDTKIPLPLVGKFYFRKRAGRKAGTVYKMPICTKNEIRTIELTEDEPDIYEIKFKPSVMLSRKVKAYFRKGVDNATSI